MSSLGYVMMNWSSLLLKDDRKQRRKEMLSKRAVLRDKVDIERRVRDEAEDKIRTRDSLPCDACTEHASRIMVLEAELLSLIQQKEDILTRLDSANGTLKLTMDRENNLRGEYDSLVLKEAQARYELDELRKQLTEELERRDLDHERQIQDMEKLLNEKNFEWSRCLESSQMELRDALNRSVQQSSVENMSRQQLEQELGSLQHVLELRAQELTRMRGSNADLSRKLDRHYYLESELGKARQRLEEMSLVVQNKMIAEKELIDMTEALTNDLSTSRNEVKQLRRELESRQYLRSSNNNNEVEFARGSSIGRVVEGSDSPSVQSKESAHRNQHQKASSGGDRPSDPTLVLDLREKVDAVAWMLHIPDSPKMNVKRATYA